MFKQISNARIWKHKQLSRRRCRTLLIIAKAAAVMVVQHDGDVTMMMRAEHGSIAYFCKVFFVASTTIRYIFKTILLFEIQSS